MPLCHNCIQTHLQLHQQRESKSQLVSVDECLNSAHESLQSLLNPLRAYLTQSAALAREKVDALTESLTKARERVLAEVGRQYDTYMASVIERHREQEQLNRVGAEQLVL